MKDQATGYIYCCGLDQSIKDRQKQKSRLPEKPGQLCDRNANAEFESPRNENALKEEQI